MISKQHEIEAIVEDFIDNTLLELLSDTFTNKRECGIALEILKDKLEDYDVNSFKDYFD
jgi:hypothetical protein